jgi:hypothetical protein
MSYNPTWFQLCAVYLDRLDTVDAYFARYDTLQADTKEEKEQKRMTFRGLMRSMAEKKDIEEELDEFWSKRVASP